MIDPRMIDELTARISAAARGAPFAEFERNLRGLAEGFFDRLDLVPREDFDVQRRLLERSLERIAALEARVTALEARHGRG